MTTINETLINFLNNSSTGFTPPGYNKQYPQDSINSSDFIATNYYNLMAAFANAENVFEYFRMLVNALINRPYNPKYCSSFLLDALRNVIGLTFVTEELTVDEIRQLLYAKLLANTNNGTIERTLDVYYNLMLPITIQRIRLGIGTVDISYTAIGGKGLLISIPELKIFWDNAKTGGVFIELRWAPEDYFGFAEDPDALGFSSISDEEVVKAVPPYFGFAEDPDATGFSNSNDPLTGGNFPYLTTATESGGCFTTILYGQQGV